MAYICNSIANMKVRKHTHKHTHKHKHYSEQITIFLSLLCTIHCILTPVLLIFLPVVGAYFVEYHWLETIIIASVFVLGTSSILHGYKEHHHNKMPAYIFFGGLMLMSAASLVHFMLDINSSTEHLLSGIGGILSGLGQLYNLRLSNK